MLRQQKCYTSDQPICSQCCIAISPGNIKKSSSFWCFHYSKVTLGTNYTIKYLQIIRIFLASKVCEKGLISESPGYSEPLQILKMKLFVKMVND